MPLANSALGATERGWRASIPAAMGDFTPWNWATYGALVIAALGIAVEAAIRRFPNLNEKVHKHRAGLLLSFGPIALVLIATVLLFTPPAPVASVVPVSSDSSLNTRNAQLQARIAELERQIEQEAPDTAAQAVIREALYEYFDGPFVAAASPLRAFSTSVRDQLGNLALPTESAPSGDALIGTLLEASVIRRDFDLTWERFSTAIDTSKREREPVPFSRIGSLFDEAYCAYERLAYWTQRLALRMPGFTQDYEPYLRWNSVDRRLMAASADLAALPNIGGFTGRWESCPGTPQPWQSQRFRIRELQRSE